MSVLGVGPAVSGLPTAGGRGRAWQPRPVPLMMVQPGAEQTETSLAQAPPWRWGWTVLSHSSQILPAGNSLRADVLVSSSLHQGNQEVCLKHTRAFGSH